LAKKENSSNPNQPSDLLNKSLKGENFNAATGPAEEVEEKENIIDPKTGKKKSAT
jgi:hypothetical protein